MNDPSWPDLVGIVVEAPGLKFKRDYEWEEGLLQRFPKLKFNALSPDSPEAIAIIKKYEVKSLPMYMLKVGANIEVYPELKGLLAGYLRDKKDDALIHSSINSRYLIESEVHPGRLALFTRPLGLDAMPDSRRYFEKISQSPTAGLKEIRLNYLVTKDEKGNFTASDGETEIEEVSRQLLIQKYFPEKFFSYALTLSANRQYKDWELILKKMEIDPKFFEKKRGEGKLLLEKNWEEAQLLSIKTVNTLVWENKRILGSGSKAWKRLAELNKTK